MKELKIKLIYGLALAVVTLLSGCSRDGLEPATNVQSYEGLQRTTLQANVMIEESEVETRTSVTYNEGANRHPVIWNLYDRIWWYSSSGVYGVEMLVEDSFPETPSHDTDYSKATFSIAFREGDPMFTAYYTGNKVGSFTGERTTEEIVLTNAIPKNQTGSFSDYHICFAQGEPTADSVMFKNLQSYLRFYLKGTETDPAKQGKIEGTPIRKMVMKAIGAEPLTGAVEVNIPRMRYSLQSDSPASTEISIDPGTDFVANKDYFIAVPVRSYPEGFRIEVFDAAGTMLSFAMVPNVALKFGEFYNLGDLFDNLVFLCTDIKFKYAGAEVTTVRTKVGHSIHLDYETTPTITTNKAVTWSCTAGSDKIEFGQDGTITGKVVGNATVKVTGNDENHIEKTITVIVEDDSGVSVSPYEGSPYSW